MQIDPVIEEWVRGVEGGRYSDAAPDAASIMMQVMSRPNATTPPPDVMLAWHRTLAQLRVQLAQSELAFAETALNDSWPIATVCTVLGRPTAPSGHELLEALRARMEDIHPSRNPAPWLGTPAETGPASPQRRPGSEQADEAGGR